MFDTVKPNSIDLRLADGETPRIILNGEDIAGRIEAEDFVLRWNAETRTFRLSATFPVVVK
jgi:hypothetical protein